jgi:hypothetical protein
MSREAATHTERSRELLRRVELRLKSAGDRLEQAVKDAGDPRELLYQLRRCEIPNAFDLIEARGELVRAIASAEKAVLAEAAGAERDTSPGVEARRRAAEVES